MVFKVTVNRPSSPSGTGGLGTDLNAIFDDFNREFFPERVASKPVTFNPDPAILEGIAEINAGIESNRARETVRRFGRTDISIIIGTLILLGGVLVITKVAT